MREEEKKRKSQKSGMKRLLSKRWALPAIYLASAAILIAAVLWFQGINNESTKPGDIGYEDIGKPGTNMDKEAVEVNSKTEKFSWPVANQDETVLKKEFYDLNGDKADQENALVQYDNKFELSRGIDVAMKDGKSFDVLAAVSGTVTKVQEDPLLGNVIEIKHEEGITTKYQSVTDIAVKVGDKVSKGQPLAKAGQSLLNQEAGIHVHFEIRKDNVAVNPLEYFEKSVTSLMEAEMVNGEASQEVDSKVKEEESTTDESKDKEDPAKEDSAEQN